MKNFTQRIASDLLEDFNSSRLLGKNPDNIFKKIEEENKVKFNNYQIKMPWYLRLFKKAVIRIAYSSFKDGMSENSTDTITFKRPAQYEGKK